MQLIRTLYQFDQERYNIAAQFRATVITAGKIVLAVFSLRYEALILLSTTVTCRQQVYICGFLGLRTKDAATSKDGLTLDNRVYFRKQSNTRYAFVSRRKMWLSCYLLNVRNDEIFPENGELKFKVVKQNPNAL